MTTIPTERALTIIISFLTCTAYIVAGSCLISALGTIGEGTKGDNYRIKMFLAIAICGAWLVAYYSGR